MIEQVCLTTNPVYYQDKLKADYYIIYHPLEKKIIKVGLNELLGINEKYVTIFYSGNDDEMNEMLTYILSSVITIRNRMTKNIIMFSIEHLSKFMEYENGSFNLDNNEDWYVADITTDILSPQKLLKGMISPALIMEKVYSRFSEVPDSLYELNKERYVILHNNFIDAFLKYLEDLHDIKLSPFLVSSFISTRYPSIKLGKAIPEKFNIEFCEKFLKIGGKRLEYI